MKPELIQANPAASAIWDYYQAKLAAAGKWRDEYGAQFAVLVDAVFRWLETSVMLNEIKDPRARVLLTNPAKGTTYRNPLLDVQAHYANIIRQYGAAFGLNPLADLRLRQSPADAIGELFKYLQGPGDA